MTDYFVDPAATGANNGTDWANAWTDLQSALTNAVAGDTTYCRGGQSLTSTTLFVTNSGDVTNGFIRFIGCNASGNNDGTRYVITVTGPTATAGLYANAARNFHLFENFEISGGQNGILITSNSDGWILNNCYIHGQSQNGIGNGATLRNGHMFRCIFDTCATSGCNGINGWTISGCKFKSCGSGITSGTGLAVHNTIFSACTTAGASVTYAGVVHNCVFHGCGTGFATTLGTLCATVQGCRFTNNTTGFTTAVAAALVNCYFDGNTTNYTGIVEVLNIDGSATHVVAEGTDSDYGYVNSATGDFNLASTATGRNFAIEID